MEERKLDKIYATDTKTVLEIPLSENKIVAGFPSPADDYQDTKLDLNKELVGNKSATFYARVKGLSMINDGIDEEDLLIIDRSLRPHNGALAVCYLDGEFTLKRFQDHGDYGLLMPANEQFQPIRVTDDNDFSIWGIVTYIIKKA